MSFLCSEKSPTVPVFPGLWPPCFSYVPQKRAASVRVCSVSRESCTTDFNRQTIRDRVVVQPFAWQLVNWQIVNYIHEGKQAALHWPTVFCRVNLTHCMERMNFGSAVLALDIATCTVSCVQISGLTCVGIQIRVRIHKGQISYRVNGVLPTAVSCCYSVYFWGPRATCFFFVWAVVECCIL